MDNITYPYALGCHLPTKMMCRILHPSINEGKIERNCILIKSYRRLGSLYRYFPYEKDGNLDAKYWSLYRAIDLERGRHVKR